MYSTVVSEVYFNVAVCNKFFRMRVPGTLLEYYLVEAF
jgi:hypothetical protein